MKKLCAVCAAALLLALGAVSTGNAGARADTTVEAELSEAIGQLNAEQKAALLVLVKSIVDAEAGKESPAAGAMKTVNAYVKAAEAADIDGLMEQFSDNFSHYEVGDKIGYRNFLEGVKADGMLEDITGFTGDAKAEVSGDTVTVHPVDLEGLFGTVTMEFELKQEGKTWKIVGMDMQGV